VLEVNTVQQETYKTAHEKDTQLVSDIIEGYCRNLPQVVVEQVLDIYYRYGMYPAMAAARMAVIEASIFCQFG
jgi:hypothetical protein